MSVAAALLAGGAIGVRHAFEADHVAAVTTLVDEESDAIQSGFVGTSWGVGHSLPVVALGLAFFLLGIRLPESVVAAFEAVVGVVLIALAIRLLLAAKGIRLRKHDHTHDSEGTQTHLGIGPLSLGSAHSHVDNRSFAVGVLHGVAGAVGWSSCSSPPRRRWRPQWRSWWRSASCRSARWVRCRSPEAERSGRPGRCGSKSLRDWSAWSSEHCWFSNRSGRVGCCSGNRWLENR